MEGSSSETASKPQSDYLPGTSFGWKTKQNNQNTHTTHTKQTKTPTKTTNHIHRDETDGLSTFTK